MVAVVSKAWGIAANCEATNKADRTDCAWTRRCSRSDAFGWGARIGRSLHRIRTVAPDRHRPQDQPAWLVEWHSRDDRWASCLQQVVFAGSVDCPVWPGRCNVANRLVPVRPIRVQILTHDPSDVGYGLRVRRHSAVGGHPPGPGVVRRESLHDLVTVASEALQHLFQIQCSSREVSCPVSRIHSKFGRCLRHQLHQPNCASRGQRVLAESGFSPCHGAHQIGGKAHLGCDALDFSLQVRPRSPLRGGIPACRQSDVSNRIGLDSRHFPELDVDPAAVRCQQPDAIRRDFAAYCIQTEAVAQDDGLRGCRYGKSQQARP